MSTRCQIGLYSKKPKKITDVETLLYRHADGYPGSEDGKEYGVLADIVPFLKRFNAKRGISDIEYLGAWLVHHMIESHMHENKFVEINDRECLSYGVCGVEDFHGDIEYYYAIYPDCIDVYEADTNDINKSKLISSINLI
jgi:hypothetical protein